MNSDAFKDRLKIAMAGASNLSFATKCDLSEGTIRRYLRGEAFPPLDTLEMIATVSGYSLAWLASGEEPRKRGDVTRHTPAYLDEQLLEAVIESVEEYLDQVKGRLSPQKKAQLVATLYDMFSEEKVVDKTTVIRLIKLAA